MLGNTLEAGHWERPRVHPVPTPVPLPCGETIFRDNSQPHSEDSDIGYGELWIDMGDYTPWYFPDYKVNFDANDVKSGRRLGRY